MKTKKIAAFVCIMMVLSLSFSAFGDDTPVLSIPEIDFTPAHTVPEENYSENGYTDDTISITMEKVDYDDATFNVARVKIAYPSQIRTGVYNLKNLQHNNKISAISSKYNAILATGGDFCGFKERGYVVRMNKVFLKKPTKSLDMLIIDGDGNFHILKKSNPEQLKQMMDSGIMLRDVFNFGPALVIDGELQQIPSDYSYNPTGREPRCAIGQTGELEYIMVVVDGRIKRDDGTNGGVTTKSLAQFMYDNGCTQAYNLDGGNSALMYFHGANYSQKSVSAERSVSDIIYFASALDFGLDK